MPFVYTTAIKKLRTLDSRIRIVPGGTSAGKTFGIIPLLIDQCAKHSGLEVSIVSVSIPHLRRGALKDFLKIMQETGRYIDSHYNRTLLTYVFSTGSYIEFFSADQEDRVRGPRRTHLYINECNNLLFDTYHQLAIRTSEVIWLDFNPTHKFWVHKEFVGDPDAQVLTLTYKDNEGLAPALVAEIEKGKAKAFHDPEAENLYKDGNIKNDYWANWWKVYGMGMVGSLQGVVFSNWSIIDDIPPDAVLKGYGLDFGYTNDPTALTAIYEWNGKKILHEVIYRVGLKNSDRHRLFIQQGVTNQHVIYADRSSPESIAELRGYGYYVLPYKSQKQEAIVYGISLMQEDDFLVTKKSTNLIHELQNYTWQTDKEGNSTNTPIDTFNHALDAARYYFLTARYNTGVNVI